jgi:hypothetical protein
MKELISIQQKLKVGKSNYNNFGKYKYRSCEDILEAVKPILNENQCLLTMSDDIVGVGDRVYIKATATVTNSDGVTISNTALAREPQVQKGMSDSQITGSASSYARKYALCGLFAIDDNTDTDSQDHTTTTRIQTIEKLLKDTGSDKGSFLSYFKIKKLSEMSAEQEQQAIVMLNKKVGQ